MKRQQTTDRHNYDWEDREELMQKTDKRCARCGTKLKPGVNSTLDHYIPLSRGGINQRLNIIPLCEDCNTKKGSKIVGTWWLKYLNKKDLDILSDYLDSYIQSFDYVTRGNLLACDMYGIRVYVGPELVTKNKAKRKKIMEAASKEYILERIRLDDLEDATSFYIEYLKKYNILESEDRARKEIEFFDRFGVIYCLRDKQGAIQILIPITIGKSKKKEHSLIMWIFALKSDSVTGACVSRIQDFFTDTLMHEQKLPYIRSEAMIPAEDKSKKYINGVEQDGICIEFLRIARDLTAPQNDDEVEFYKKFYDVRKHMKEFFSQEGYDEIEYLGEMILEGFGKESL